MSILIRGNSNGRSTYSRDGYPCGSVTNINYKQSNQSVSILWNDPSDTIIEGITISEWAGTILIRKTGGYPESIVDGEVVVDSDIRNQYSDGYFQDTGLSNGTKYYYRFFTYNTDGIYNDDSNMMFTATPIAVSDVFSENTWETISNFSENGSASSLWSVGDEIDVNINGTIGDYSTNITMPMRILGFNHYYKSNGTGSAGILLGSKYLLPNTYYINQYTNTGGWSSSYMRETIMNDIYNALPSELQSVIKSVKIYSDTGYNNYSPKETSDKIFIPSTTEIGVGYGNEYNPDPANGYNSDYYLAFTDNNSRIITTARGEKNGYWLRTTQRTSSTYFWFIEANGTGTYTYGAQYKGVFFCFCV